MRSILGILVAFGILPILSACAAPATTVSHAAEPRAILVLAESHYELYLSHPWPVDLRLVAYDNGLVIRQPMQLSNPEGPPHFVSQQRSPGEIQALVAEVKAAALAGVELTRQDAPLPLHAGDTRLEYWDADAQTFVSLYAYGTPCSGNDDDAKKPWVAEMRPLTDPRFVKLCDDVLRFPLDGAEDWHPQEMLVQLLATESQTVDKVVPWPRSWPRKWRVDDGGGYKQITLCVPVGTQPDNITAQILSPGSEVWTKNVAVGKSGREWWTITAYAAQAMMPYRVENWASGPCSADPRFK